MHHTGMLFGGCVEIEPVQQHQAPGERAIGIGQPLGPPDPPVDRRVSEKSGPCADPTFRFGMRSTRVQSPRRQGDCVVERRDSPFEPAQSGFDGMGRVRSLQRRRDERRMRGEPKDFAAKKSALVSLILYRHPTSPRPDALP